MHRRPQPPQRPGRGRGDAPSIRRASPAVDAPASSRSAGICCLGAGEDPRRSQVEKRSSTASTPSHPDIQLDVRGRSPTPAPATRSRPQIASGNRPDIVGPVGIGGAEAFHGQWLDLAPLHRQDQLRHDPVPGRAPSTSTRSAGGPGRHPVRDLSRRCCSTRRTCSRRPASPSRRTSTATSTRCPTAPVVPWDYDTARKLAMLLTVDKNGKDATQAGFDPDEDRAVGLRAAARRPAQVGAYWRPASSPAAPTARPSRSRRPGRPPGSGSTTGSGRTTSSMTGPQFVEHRLQPRAATRSSPATSR